MIALRLAAIVAALTTIILNAHAGYKSTPVWEYAVLFAVLNATLDIAKCSCLVGMNTAWRHGHGLSAVLLFIVFWPLLGWSLYNGLSEVAISKGTAAGQYQADTKSRSRAEADHARLTRELATMQDNATFTATAACALPKTNAARDFCATVAATKAALAAADGQISTKTSTDPQPHLTLVAAFTGTTVTDIQFTVALVPVLLAELVGSVGFLLSRRLAPEAPAKPVDTRSRFWLPRLRWNPKSPIAAPLEASGTITKPVAALNGGNLAIQPTVKWSIPS